MFGASIPESYTNQDGASKYGTEGLISDAADNRDKR
jgi:hypothetical protein